MKTDNPMLTAFALGELSPAEHAEIEQDIRSDLEVATEVAETKEMIGILREGFAAERGALGNHQRDAIFRELELLEKEHSLSGGGGSTTQAFAPLIVPRSTWWNRTGTWQAIAACCVAGFAGYALLVNVGGYRRSAGSQAGEIVVQLSPENGAQSGATTVPDLISPKNAGPSEAVASGLNGLKAGSNVPKISVTPVVPIDGKPPLIADKSAEALPPVAKAPDEESPAERPRRGPYVVGSKNPDLAAADVGRNGNKTEPVTEENLAAYLKEQKLGTRSTYQEFLRLFQPVPNKPGRYELVDAPSIQVEATFTTPEGQPLTSPPSPTSRVKQISKTFLE